VKRHDLDVLSLVSGLLFTGLAVAFLLDALDVWSADVTWVPAIVLIALGIGGMLSVWRRNATLAVADAPAPLAPPPSPPVTPPATDAAEPLADSVDTEST
jgi:hypothetical protein